MLTIKRLNECKLDEVVQAWNEGFAGYFFNMTMTVDTFVSRLALEELSPSLSIVAFEEDRPVGLVLNGIRDIQGSKVAWNGGTAVAEAYRGKGISGALMDHALRMYREENVRLATLEAISENEKAIRLYKGKGYATKDHILYMNNDHVIPNLIDSGEAKYAYKQGTPHDVKEHAELLPWQSQWHHFRRDGETLLVRENGRLIAYVLFKRTYSADGINNGVSVGQVRVLEEREDTERLVRFLLAKTLHPERESYKRMLPVLASDVSLLRALEACGFKQAFKQVWMTKEL